MEFRLLGLLEVEDEHGPVRIVPGRESALLALLLLHSGAALSNDRIVDELWGDAAPENAAKSVHVYVSRLRKALGAARLETTPAGYRIVVKPGELDLQRFETALDDGRFADALALWRGEPLAEFRYATFAQAEARRLEGRRKEAIAELLDARLATGDAPVAELEAIVEQDRLWERPRGQLMRALYLAGRQADALALYRETRELLADELGVDPGPELQRLERAILNQDPELGTPAPSARAVRAKGRRPLLVVVGGTLLLVAAIAAAVVLGTRGTGHLSSVAPGSVAVIDAHTNGVIAQIGVGNRPSRLAVAGHHLWALNAGDGTITEVDTSDDRVSAPFGPSLVPSDLAATANALWVGDAPIGAGQGATRIARFDPVRHTRTGTTALAGAPVPGGGRPAEERYLVAAGSTVWAIGPTLEPVELDARTGRVRRVVHVFATSLAFADGTVWAASGRSVARIDPRSGRFTEFAVPSIFDVEGIAAGGGAAWATSFSDGLVWRIRAGPLEHVSSIPVGYGVSTIAYGAGAVWVGNRFDDTISRIDPQTSKVTRVATVPAPQDLQVAGGRVYVAAGVPSGRHGALTAAACGRRAGPGEIELVSDLPLHGVGSGLAAASVATIRSVLRSDGYRAGRFRLSYQSCDDSSDSAGGFDDGQCVANAAAFADDSSVVGVVGPLNSECAQREIPLENRAPHGPLALISPFATGPFLTRSALGDAAKTLAAFYAAGPRNFFRTVGADHIQVTAGAVFAKRLGATRVAVVYSGSGMLQVRQEQWFVRAARRLGIAAVPVLWSSDRGRFAAALKRAHADAAFVVSYAANWPGTTRALALTLGVVLPGRPVVVTDAFDPAAIVTGNQARFYGLLAGLGPGRQTAAAVRALIAAIAASDGSRRSVVEHLATRFDRWGDPATAPVQVFRLMPRLVRRVATITPPASLVPPG
ncbi:MAG TPA: BTAD domain-containing putative transcriptional regulator [Gaiellaceae bacterium]|nr:BTAD domain-containing putative transcriptional regulator [Gaiellaceae bacterium]